MGHKEDLLAGAKRCLLERGYAGTTARDIVAASHTNLASIGYHFGSKDALLTEAMIELIGEWGKKFEAAAQAHGESGSAARFEGLWREVLNLFDVYVHGGMDRRAFLESVQRFATGAMTATAIWESLRPNYAWAKRALAILLAWAGVLLMLPRNRRDEWLAFATAIAPLALLASLFWFGVHNIAAIVLLATAILAAVAAALRARQMKFHPGRQAQ